MLLKTVRIIDNTDPANIKVEFKARSLKLDEIDKQFSETNNLKKYSILDCKFANTYITIQDINIDMKYNFLIHMNEELPQYMENMIGLMMKKIFYNVKKFVDKIEDK